MLKSQDCVILLKIIANLNRSWTQRELAQELYISQSEIHSGIKRLTMAGLVRYGETDNSPNPIMQAAAEYLLHGLKYSFPAKIGEYTRGIATGVGAPIFKGKIILGNDPIPIWPYGKGDVQGVAVQPLYPGVPQSIIENPDPKFYDLLSLIDVLRVGRARERAIAIKLLKEYLNYE